MVATVPPASPPGQTDILSFLFGHSLQTPDKAFVQAELPTVATESATRKRGGT